MRAPWKVGKCDWCGLTAPLWFVYVDAAQMAALLCIGCKEGRSREEENKVA